MGSFGLSVIRYMQAIIVSLQFSPHIISFSTGFLILVFVVATSEQLLSEQVPALIVPAYYYSEQVN